MRQKITVSVLEDLEEAKKELQEKSKSLEAANKRLEELSRLKDEFVAAVSHELRTPLTAIKEGVSLLIDQVLGPVNTEQKDFLKTVDESVDRLTELINNMLDLAKIEAGRIQLVRRKAALADLIRTAVEAYKPMARPRTLNAVLDPVSDVFADPNRILQVLGNLVSNAVKSTPLDGIVTIRAKEKEGEVVVSVEDNGTGIAKEDLPKLFQKFSQVVRGTNRSRGTGLGLALSKEIVELHKGQISVTSQSEKGSKFAFTLPIYSSEFALEENFKEQLEMAHRTGRETVGLTAFSSEPVLARLSVEEAMEWIRKHLHSTDSVLSVEPDWIVILAVTEAQGLDTMMKRIQRVLEDWAPIAVNLGKAVYPADGADVHQLLSKATSNLSRITVGGHPR